MKNAHTQPRAKRWPWILAGIVTFVVFVGSCSAMATVPHPDQHRVQPAPTLPMPVVPQTAAPDQMHINDDGAYAVGEDVAAGKWKTAGKGDGSMGCSITVRAADGRSVDDAKYGTGQAYVTVRNGQTIEVSNCQPLVLVKAASK